MKFSIVLATKYRNLNSRYIKLQGNQLFYIRGNLKIRQNSNLTDNGLTM